MPRFGFKSSSRENNGLSLNTPRSSRSSKKDNSFSKEMEQVQKDRDSKSKQSSKNSRRRNFGFLKSGKIEKKSGESKNVLSRRREHAKQLANLAYSDDPTTSISTTATSTSTHDSAYNMSNTIISPTANNNTANTDFFALPQAVQTKRRTHSRPRTNSNKSHSSSGSTSQSSNDAFGADPFASFDAFGMSSSAAAREPEPTAKYSANDFSELDFFATQLAGATTPVYQNKEKQQHYSSSSKRGGGSSRGGRTSGPVSLDHFFDDETASFASNLTGNDLSTIDSNGNSVSAAARRRMRSHMQQHQQQQTKQSQSDVGSVGSSSLGRSRSTPQMPPPGSPSIPANPKRHSSYVAKNTNNNSKTNSGWGTSDHRSPIRSTASTTSSTANYSSASPSVNLFDSDNDAGFTFDAFGLDESQVEREVNSAMKDILGHGGFSIFDGGEDNSGSNRTFESGSESGNNSGNNSVSSGKSQTNNRSHNTSHSYGQDSFSGHQTDTSENSFEVQNWDSSPNTSRGPSPVPLHFSKNGVGASPATPNKPPVKLSSVQQRRLARSAQKGTTVSVAGAVATPPRRNSHNSRGNRQISSEPPAKTRTSMDFAAFDTATTKWQESNPWQEDPFASSDAGGRISDLFHEGSSRDAGSTARRLYSETQSNVHDYYPSGGMTAAANSLLDAAASPKHNMMAGRESMGSIDSNYARSDIGVSGRAHLPFDSPDFFELPPAESGNQTESGDESDDMDQMQDDLAQEFARDIVRRISPSGRSQGSNSHHSSPSKSARSYRTADKPGRRIQYGDDRIDEDESDDQAPRDRTPQHDSNYQNNSEQQYSSRSMNNTTQEPNKSTTAPPSASRFGSFRSRYERSRSQSAMSKAKTPTASNAKTDLGRNTYHGSLRSSYNASRRTSTSSQSVSNEQPKAMPDEPKIVRKWERNDGAPIEEKKEEEISSHHRAPNPSQPPKKVNSLRARWEAKTRAAPVEKPVQKEPPKPSERSDHTKKQIKNMDNSFEMLTPDIMEQRRQSRNKDKFNNLRKSMGVVDEPKSESGGWNGGSAILDKVLDHVDQDSPTRRPQPSNVSPVTSPVGRKMTYRERREMELNAQREQEEAKAKPVERPLTWKERREIELRTLREKEEGRNANPPSQHQTVEKKMSYRERREMELKLQNKQEEKMPQDTPKNDVASLIRKRISANKKKDSPPQNSNQSSQNTSNQPERDEESPKKDPAKMLNNLFASRAPPATKQSYPEKAASAKPSHQMLENFLSAKTQPNKHDEKPVLSTRDVSQKVAVPDDVSQADAKSMLSGFLNKKRSSPALPLTSNENDANAYHGSSSHSKDEEEAEPPAALPTSGASNGLPALKDDPKFEKYFRMLKMGLPLEVAKHAMVRDGLDPSVLDMDHNKPLVVGVPLKDDPKYTKYFKMLKIGLPIEQVKHAMERDGLNPSVMDQDHNLPVIAVEKKKAKKKKETHRRARLHWKSFGKILKNSLWDTVQSEVGGISIDEDEFDDLFQAELKASNVFKTTSNNSKKKGAQVRVIDPKRANNGGIILARVKLTHDQMADAVDRIDTSTLAAEQIENVIEYLPTKEERDALEKYMLEGGQDAAEKFDGLCECEKFMVSMMTVKHAKRKIRALLFKLQFMTCMESIAKDAQMIDTACDELINSNRLRQLLGIILQFGNRLNTAGSSNKTKAGGFSLESLSKLSQAKAFDKKTTFLHYIILIVERNNELLLKYYDDIPTVLESDNIFWDQCQQDLEEVENQLENVRRIALHEARSNADSQVTGVSDDDSLGELELTLEEEVVSLRATKTGLFTLGAIKQVSALREKIERTRAKCVRLKQYFGVTSQTTEPQEIFSVFVNFTSDFKKAKEQVFSTAHKRLREDRKKARQNTPKKPKNRESTTKSSSQQPSMNKLFGDIQQRQPSNSSSRQDAQNDVQSSRAGLLSSIKERQSPSERSAPSPSPRAGLMDSIKKRNPSPSPADPRAGLLDAIKKRQPPSGPPADPRAGLLDAIKKRQPPSGPPADPRAGLLDAIKKRQPPSGPPADPRAGLLDAIKKRQSPNSPLADPRAGLLDAIKKRQPLDSSGPPVDPRAGLLNAIKLRNQDSETDNATASSSGNQFVTERHQMAGKPTGSRSPREAMRHRRRMEAVRSRHGE